MQVNCALLQDGEIRAMHKCRSALRGLGCWTIDAEDADATQDLLAHVSLAQEGVAHLEASIREGICQPIANQ